MELIYSSPNGNQIQQLQDILNDQGIPSRIIRKSAVKNEYKAIGYSFTELWLTNELQYQCAKSLISRFESRHIKESLNMNHLNWDCEEENQAWITRTAQHSVPSEQPTTATQANLNDSEKSCNSNSNKTDTKDNTPTTILDESLALELITKWFQLKRFTNNSPNGTCKSYLDYVPSHETQPKAPLHSMLVIEPSSPYWIHQSRKQRHHSDTGGLTPKHHALRHYHNG